MKKTRNFSISTKELLLLRKIREQAHETVSKFGLAIPAKECTSEIKRMVDEYVVQWNLIRNDILKNELTKEYNSIICQPKPSTPLYLLTLPTLFTFGYSIGSQLNEILGGNTHENRQAGILSGLMNMNTSIFDMIYDDAQHLNSQLLEMLDKDTIEYASNLYNYKKSFGFVNIKNENVFEVKFLGTLTNEYFSRIHQLWNPIDSNVAKEFHESILLSYESEINTRKIELDSKIPLNDIYSTFFNKSKLPFWIMCLNSIISLSDQSFTQLNDLKIIMNHFGKCFWIVDDISDISKDRDEKQWNIVLLKLHNDFQIPIFDSNGNLRPKSELLQEIIIHNVIEDLMIEMCENYFAGISKINKLKIKSNDFERNILIWLNLWLN